MFILYILGVLKIMKGRKIKNEEINQQGKLYLFGYIAKQF